MNIPEYVEAAVRNAVREFITTPRFLQDQWTEMYTGVPKEGDMICLDLDVCWDRKRQGESGVLWIEVVKVLDWWKCAPTFRVNVVVGGKERVDGHVEHWMCL